MEGVTRRTCLAMGVPLLAGAAAYGSGDLRLWGLDPRSRFQPAGSPRATLQHKHLPNVPLVTHDGRRVRFYDDLVRGKKVVLTFVSSRAPAESRTVTHNLASVQTFFGDRVGRDIFLYSIARTPERDTPALLRDWATRVGAGPGWKFVTGAPASLDVLRRRLGFASDSRAEDADPAYSVGLLRHGVEPEMRWAHCQSQAAARVMVHSMLLDFGPGTGDRITWNLAGSTGPGSAPVWNCKLLLAAVK